MRQRRLQLELLALLFLAICSYMDIKYKAISIFVIILFSCLGIICMFVFHGTEWIFNPSCLLNLLLGVIVLLVSYVSRGEIGQGDAIVLMVTGGMIGGYRNCVMFFYASIIAGIYALALIIVKEQKRERVFPFIPFLFIGDVTLLIMSNLSY